MIIYGEDIIKAIVKRLIAKNIPPTDSAIVRELRSMDWAEIEKLFSWLSPFLCYTRNMKKIYTAKTPNFEMSFPAPSARDSLDDAMRFAEAMVARKVPVTVFCNGEIIWKNSWQSTPKLLS